MSQPEYEIVYLTEACVDPDGHDTVKNMSMTSLVPVSAYCLCCGVVAQIIVFGLSPA